MDQNWGALRVDEEGSIRVWRPLDREGPQGPEGEIKVVAVDRGDPPRSATTTLSITLKDVNDSPPRLLPPTVLHITENFQPQK